MKYGGRRAGRKMLGAQPACCTERLGCAYAERRSCLHGGRNGVGRSPADDSDRGGIGQTQG